ncbi:MAG: glycosyltransferase family 2 protein [Lachnospiraceae bacterium]|nr:glycosyltransferase family 2 protein [Lachnospiraceae bacterium]
MTISLCMIVKNEEKILARCIDSLTGIFDEAIIVDTGSSDSTKEIALKYTDKVYDFEWIDDFAAARNFAMSKATCDYIYMADADEVLDEENREKFLRLKEALDGEVEVVQMNYVNQLQNGSVYNFDKEPRAKLYLRQRQFKFVDPVHEVVRELPIVYDSDIDIIHLQQENHAGRDLKTFRKAIEKDGSISSRLIPMYARELLLGGSNEDFLLAEEYFESLLSEGTMDADILRAVYVVLAQTALIKKDTASLLKYALKDIASEGCSEMCSILGAFFETRGDLNEAAMWYYNARYETAPIINLKSNREVPLNGLIRVYEAAGAYELAAEKKKELKETEEKI